MDLTLEDLKRIMPAAGERAAVFLAPLNSSMAEFEINTPKRQAAFLAQIAHESGSLARVSENLNYSYERLLQVFPKYFDAATAGHYARQPERIANRVYANRMGNGDEASGDGWRNRGAGLIQTTGANNHARVAEHFGIPREQVGDWLRTPEGACRSAGLFWYDNGLNALADAGDFLRITKRVNGGTHGLEERTAFLNRANAQLGVA